MKGTRHEHMEPPRGFKYCPVCFEQLSPFRDEDDFQANVVHLFRALFKDAEIVHHSNNQTNKIAGAKAKVKGVLAGWPDLEIYKEGGRVFFIELKVDGGKISPVQAEQHKRLRSLGFVVYVSYTLENVVSILKKEML